MMAIAARKVYGVFCVADHEPALLSSARFMCAGPSHRIPLFLVSGTFTYSVPELMDCPIRSRT